MCDFKRSEPDVAPDAHQGLRVFVAIGCIGLPPSGRFRLMPAAEFVPDDQAPDQAEL